MVREWRRTMTGVRLARKKRMMAKEELD